MRKQWRTWIVLFSLCSPAVVAQTGAGPRVITQNVVVTDKSGQPVSGLQEQDFTLLDNKRPKKLASFRAVDGPSAELPVRLILVVDEVNDTFTNVANERTYVGKFLQTNDGKLALPTSLAFFSDSGAVLGREPSTDGKALFTELNSDKNSLRVIGRSEGVYGAGDRLQLSLRALQGLIRAETAQPGRKLVVWISPGWPLFAGAGQQENITQKTQQQVYTTIVNLSAQLRDAGITLYNVNPLGAANIRDTFVYEEFLKGVSKPSKAQFGDLGLQVLAQQSGGLVFAASNDLSGEIAKCVTDAKAFYVISFAADPSDEKNDYHALEIKLGKAGMTARTRTGYYAK
jgi:VWFA-related protein